MHIKRKARSTGEVPASALSDMAFLLLIFFIVVAVFAPRIGISVLLHDDARQAASQLQPGEVIHLEGRGESTLIYKEKKHSLNWVHRFLREAGKQNPEVAVKLHLGPKFRYGHMVSIASWVNNAGIQKFQVEGESR